MSKILKQKIGKIFEWEENDFLSIGNQADLNHFTNENVTKLKQKNKPLAM